MSGYSLPISDDLLALISSKTGSTSLATVTSHSKMALANVPLIGSVTGLKRRAAEMNANLDTLTIRGLPPQCKNDWIDIFEALRLLQDIWMFQKDVWFVHQLKDSWPQFDFLQNPSNLKMFEDVFRKALHAKRCETCTDLDEHCKLAAECRCLDARRSVLSSKLQKLAEELVDSTLVAELSKNFSADAQSALIRFAQLAGKQSFSQSTKLSKMTQRQRRRRQEYLDAFDKCCRFIPCWIMTTSQISDYLPAECLFDLTVIDECSQSDVTALPGMLRGYQWLIVGDGKQVSPTESFVSEETLDSLRATLPQVPFASSMLPGQSLFDLCAQAFPQGRVVLNEHFRCAPEIINFSNENFYNESLVSMRLPTQSERITPSICDVRVTNGKKNGKSNAEEASAIIKYVEEIVSKSNVDNPRSIGIISLMGSEQSQLIRSGLLERIGPHRIATHNILVGDPPTFQGTERDIIILSMVCSKGSSPTQNQLMHFQRANVAMSRARDQLVLFRSLDIQDVPSPEDMKIPILEFFLKWSSNQEDSDQNEAYKEFNTNSYQHFLAKNLVDLGYKVRSMGKVWKNGICVEHPKADSRVGLFVECVEDSIQDWHLAFKQQKAIERVGWKCLRVDIVSLATRLDETMDSIVRFLRSHGISQPLLVHDTLEEDIERDDIVGDAADSAPMEDEHEAELRQNFAEGRNLLARDDSNAYVVVSSDEEDSKRRKICKLRVRHPDQFDVDEVDASVFGETVELDFLLANPSNDNFFQLDDDEITLGPDMSGRNERQQAVDESESTRNSRSTKDTTSGYAKRQRTNVFQSRKGNDESVNTDDIISGKAKRKIVKTQNAYHDTIDSDQFSNDEQVVATHSFGKGTADYATRRSTEVFETPVPNCERVNADDALPGKAKRKIINSKKTSNDATNSGKFSGDELVVPTHSLSEGSTSTSSMHSYNRCRKRYRRLEKYQRDGTWIPKALGNSDNASDSEHSYDTDADLVVQKAEKNDNYTKDADRYR